MTTGAAAGAAGPWPAARDATTDADQAEAREARDATEELAAATPRSRLAITDLLDEAFAGALARPARAVLTALGTVFGVAALVATLGVTKTASNQIVARFDALAATEVVVTPTNSDGAIGRGGATPSPQGQGGVVVSELPFDAQDRLERLNGVRAAGTLSQLDIGGALARSVPVSDPLGIGEHALPVFAASPGLFPAVHATLRSGRYFDEGHSARADRVAVLGPAAAARLGVSRLDVSPAIFVGDETLIVIGILDDVSRGANLLGAVIIPDGTARDRFGLQAPAEVHIDTTLGAARLIGRQAPIALDPNQPDRLTAQVPPDPQVTRRRVQSDTDALFLVLGGVSLLVGALGIANVTLVSVLERVGEIGLRRAMGAARRHIAAQFLVESTGIGFVGGLVGTSLGVLVVVGVAATRSWTPVLDPRLPLAAPLAGALVGLLAGAYPAWRASAVEPITALRAGL